MQRKVLISTNEIDWKPYEPKKKEPKVELQKVDTAKFVFFWENSSSVEEFIELGYEGAADDPERLVAHHQALARMIRNVEDIPLRQLPDHPPKAKSGKINNLTLPKE